MWCEMKKIGSGIIALALQDFFFSWWWWWGVASQENFDSSASCIQTTITYRAELHGNTFLPHGAQVFDRPLTAVRVLFSTWHHTIYVGPSQARLLATGNCCGLKAAQRVASTLRLNEVSRGEWHSFKSKSWQKRAPTTTSIETASIRRTNAG